MYWCSSQEFLRGTLFLQGPALGQWWASTVVTWIFLTGLKRTLRKYGRSVEWLWLDRVLSQLIQNHDKMMKQFVYYRCTTTTCWSSTSWRRTRMSATGWCLSAKQGVGISEVFGHDFSQARLVSKQSYLLCVMCVKDPWGAEPGGVPCQRETVLLYHHRDPPGPGAALLLQQRLLQADGWDDSWWKKLLWSIVVMVIHYQMLNILPFSTSPQVFLRCLRVRSASVAKSAPPSLSSSLTSAAITVTIAITNLHTATAHRSRTTLSSNSNNHSNSSSSSNNRSSRHNSSNTLTRRISWPMGPQAPPPHRGPATPTLRDKQTVTTAVAGAAVTETLTIMLHPERKVRVTYGRRNSSAACVPGLLSHPPSSTCTSWGTWGWNHTSANIAAKPSVIPATSGCT